MLRQRSKLVVQLLHGGDGVERVTSNPGGSDVVLSVASPSPFSREEIGFGTGSRCVDIRDQVWSGSVLFGNTSCGTKLSFISFIAVQNVRIARVLCPFQPFIITIRIIMASRKPDTPTPNSNTAKPGQDGKERPEQISRPQRPRAPEVVGWVEPVAGSLIS